MPYGISHAVPAEALTAVLQHGQVDFDRASRLDYPDWMVGANTLQGRAWQRAGQERPGHSLVAPWSFPSRSPVVPWSIFAKSEKI